MAFCRSSVMLMAVLFIAACTGKDGAFDLSKPISMNITAPDGPANYRQGWNDGCESALSATGTKIQMLMGSHQYTYDPKLRYDVLYSKAWKYAYTYCSYSMRTLYRYKL